MLLKEKNTTEKTFAKTHRGWGGAEGEGEGGGETFIPPTHSKLESKKIIIKNLKLRLQHPISKKILRKTDTLSLH